LDSSAAASYPQDGNPASQAYEEMCYIYSRQLEYIWNSLGDPVTDFSTVEAEYEAIFAAAQPVLAAGMAFQPLGFYPDNGRRAASCQRTYAEMHYDYARRIMDRTPDFGADYRSGIEQAVYENSELARIAFEDLLAKIDEGTWMIRDWQFSASVHILPKILLDLMANSAAIGGTFPDVDMTDLENYMNRVYSLVAVGSVHPQMERDALGELYSDVGESIIHAGEVLQDLGIMMQIDGTDAALDPWSDHYAFAEVYLQQAVDNFTDVQDGRISAKATYRLGLLYQSWASNLVEEGNIPGAEAYYNAALSEFDKTRNGGILQDVLDGTWDDWVLDDSDNRISDINAILLAAPFV